MTISKKNQEIDALQEKISAASQQTEKLQEELDNLNDPAYLERIAREKLGLVEPNERFCRREQKRLEQERLIRPGLFPSASVRKFWGLDRFPDQL